MKKCDAECLTLTNIITTYFKRWKMYKNWGKCRSFICPMDKKMISPHIEWCITKSHGLCTIFFKTNKMVPKIIICQAVMWQLFRILGIFSNLYAQTVLCGLTFYFCVLPTKVACSDDFKVHCYTVLTKSVGHNLFNRA